ncbi:Trafficking kinesin-binding protein [Dirofilaria immitis]
MRHWMNRRTNTISDNSDDDNDNTTTMFDTAKELAEKEKDLELAAKIGQSLLEQNHELQTKNEFLEEALNASNDIVVQLRHDLHIRSNLLRFYTDYDTDLETYISGQSNSDNLQQKIKRLEDENQSLKNESTNLKKVFSELEENEQLHILEWTKQLDTANDKICNLQHLLAEKNQECGIQNSEMEKLLREVAIRSSHEKMLANEADDLHQQLQEALKIHEELMAHVAELQERYTEVLAMLHDAEEELRTYRQNQSAYRTSTPDSLYDSLASEIEASDSGFYSSINNPRIQTKQEDIQSKMDTNHLSKKLELIKSNQIDISNVTETRSIATVTDPLPPHNRYRQNSHSDDSVIDVPNQILTKLLRNSHPSHLSLPFLGNTSTSSNNDEPGSSSSSISKPETKIFGINTDSTKTCISQQQEQQQQQQQPFNEINLKDSVSQYPTYLMYDLNRTTRYNSDCLSKTESTDSLSGYEGPKLGEPGRPGTRDLDWSIRKLNIRRQIEREYTRFRRERGLLPLNTSFFNTLSNKMPSNSMKKYCYQRIIQHGVLSSSNSVELQKKSEITNDISRIFKCGKIFSKNIGTFASLHDSLAHGIVFRSAISVTPPVTPIIRQNRKSFICDIPSSSSCLLEALGLCLLSKALPLSLIPKRMNRFQSMPYLNHDSSATTTTTTTATFFLPEQLKINLRKANIL